MTTEKRRGGPRPNSGGARPGAGRKPVGRRRLELDQETARTLYVVARHGNTTPEQLIANWVAAAWMELNTTYQERAEEERAERGP